MCSDCQKQEEAATDLPVCRRRLNGTRFTVYRASPLSRLAGAAPAPSVRGRDPRVEGLGKLLPESRRHKRQAVVFHQQPQHTVGVLRRAAVWRDQHQARLVPFPPTATSLAVCFLF